MLEAIGYYETEIRRRGSEVAAVSIESMQQIPSTDGLAWMGQVVE